MFKQNRHRITSLFIIIVSIFFLSCSSDSDSAVGTKVTVTFHSNGGTAVSAQSLNSGELLEEPAEPTMESVIFSGWYADQALTSAWNFSEDKVLSDMVLYAKWLNGEQSMVLVFNTRKGNSTKTVALPLHGEVDATINWGDGSEERVTSPQVVEHTYENTALYEVTITGKVTHFGPVYENLSQSYFENYSMKLFEVKSFGELGITSLHRAFSKNFNELTVPDYLPQTVTDLSYLFQDASKFNDDISEWNTGNVTDMHNMFDQALVFNQDISGWNTGSVTDMSWMFQQAYKFNQDIGEWNTANVTDMSWMFQSAYEFDQDIGKWKTDKVRNMASMFSAICPFNQDISGWNTVNVTNMSWMFARNSNFNQDLSDWNVDKVEDFDNMDLDAKAWKDEYKPMF